MALTDGIQLLIHANEGEGIIAADSSGNGNDADLIGATWNTATPKLGPAALSLDGLNDYGVGVSPFGNIDFRFQAFTFMTWMFTTGPDSEPIITFGASTASNHIPNFVYSTAFNRLWLNFHRADNGIAGRDGVSADIGGLANGWHLMIATHDGSGIVSQATSKLNVDTVDITDGDFAGSWGAFQQNKYLIGRVGDPDFFKGSLDEIAVWNRVITPAEIAQLWNGGAGIEIGIAGRRRRMLVS